MGGLGCRVEGVGFYVGVEELVARDEEDRREEQVREQRVHLHTWLFSFGL